MRAPMLVEISLRLAPVRGRGVLLRGLILTLVVACAMFAFSAGVYTSERPDLIRADVLTRIYYTIGLFVLGGLDLGTPAGGTPLGRGLLWLAYFAAPAITTVSVIEGVLRTFAPERWHLRRMRNHIVIAGAGGITRLYIEQLRARDRHTPVIVVELQRNHPAATILRHQAHMLVGDIRSDAVIDVLRLEHAQRVLLLTGDDFANLDAASKILARVPSLAHRTVAHVSNLHFMRVLGDTPVARSCEIFNSHELAATHLVRTTLLPYFQHTEFRDVIVLAGFGRFGQSVLDTLQRHACDKFGRAVIMDLEAGKRAAVFAQQVGFADFYEREVIDGDLRDPRVWEQLHGLHETEPVFVLGSGDDGTNLRTALWVNSAFPSAYVVARTFGRSPFADEVAGESGFLAFSVADLVLRSMPQSWFTDG